jgi:predicted nucleic acid-binding protein
VARQGAWYPPDLVDVETVAVFRKGGGAGEPPARHLRVAVEDLLALPVVRVPSGPLMRRAYELRANLTAYDAAYVALAEALDCALLTADARLARAPGLRCPVELIGLEVRPHHRRDPTRGR